MSYYLESDSYIRDTIKLVFDFTNYATKEN